MQFILTGSDHRAQPLHRVVRVEPSSLPISSHGTTLWPLLHHKFLTCISTINQNRLPFQFDFHLLRRTQCILTISTKSMYTSSLSTLALWFLGRTRNSSVKRMHSPRFSGETKPSATFIQDWEIQQENKNETPVAGWHIKNGNKYINLRQLSSIQRETKKASTHYEVVYELGTDLNHWFGDLNGWDFDEKGRWQFL